MTSQHHRYQLAISSAALLLPLLAGCASPGPPKPPSLNLSEPVTDLTAERIGDQVILHWTTRSDTTDGLDMKGPMTAEVCRETTPTRPHPTCTPLTRVHVKAGPSQATDPLPEALTSEPAALIAYRVQVFNSDNRAAGLSNQAFAASGAAPLPVQNLRGAATRGGAILQWQPTNSASTTWVRLDRTLLPGFTAPSAPPKPTAPKSSLDLSPAEPNNVTLETPKGPDPGGTVDRTVRKAERYTYQAQRIRSVALDGHTLDLRSTPSSAITIEIADTFPPQPPTGLDAVPGEAAKSSSQAPNNNNQTATIDLSWEPVPDVDLAGYLVYRRAANSQTFEKLTPTPITPPAFTDTSVVPGQRYTYRVTATDTSGNESQPSNEAEETATTPHS